MNGKTWQTVTLTENNLTEKEIVLRVPAEMLKAGANRVSLARSGGNSPIFYSVETRQTLPTLIYASLLGSGGKPGESLTVKREYRRVSSRQSVKEPWKINSDPISGESALMKAGEQIRVRLTIYAPRDISYVLIKDAFPAGCEVNERGDAGEESEIWGFWWSSVDVRDDHIAFFARTLSRGEHQIEYNLRPQTPGRYHALPTLVQAMYSPDEKAHSTEATVEVKP